ncbi:hypothetical protein ACFVGY_00695 [Streptomyces sp. NPDC127106]|uniref:hypothetical protein n=1 Tax=Streptomyces sp. NPDC127106 TaxID=3345360 RepID=UPI00363661EF
MTATATPPDPRAGHPGAASGTGPRTPAWLKGCGITLLVLAGLAGLGLWALDEVAKGLDGYGQLEQTGGADGSVADPLGPGATARYEDGLKVTVGRPRPEADGTYRFTVTYRNGTDEEQHPAGESAASAASEYGPAPVVVRAGRTLEDYAPDSVRWLNLDESAAALMPPLAEDGARTVPVRVKPSRKGMTVTVQVCPPDKGYRETAYWQFTLD